MADSFTMTYTDQQTGKPVRGTVKRMPTDAELASLKQQYGESVTVAPLTQQEKIVGVKRNEPSAKKAITDLGEVAAYAALGLIPGGAAAKGAARIGTPAIAKFLAAHPQVAGAVTRMMGASGISAGGAAVKGEDVGKAAKDSGLVQGALEAVIPPAYKVGARLGGGAWRKQADQVASSLMQRAKAAVPWFKPLPESHEGLRALVEFGEGPALLSEHYGKLLGNVKAMIAPEAKMALSLEDAQALKIGVKDMELDLPAAYAGKGISADEAKKMGIPVTQARVPIHTVIDKMGGVGKKDPALYHRTVEAVDQAIPDIASEVFTEGRRVYREGRSLIQGLKDMNVIDEGTKRLNVERLSKGSATLDANGQSVYERSLKAPESKRAVKESVPKGDSPHAVGIPFVKATPTHVYGGFHGSDGPVKKVLENTQPPSIFYSGNVPLTPKEETIKRYAPGAVHALTKETGVSP